MRASGDSDCVLRVVSWNCQRGLKKPEKLEFIGSLNADLLILQESREGDLADVAGRVWLGKPEGSRSNLGLGVYPLNSMVQVSQLKGNIDFELYLPIAINFRGSEFRMMCVWASNHRSSGKFKGKRGVFSKAIDQFENYIGPKAIWVGDFNNGPEIRKGKSWGPALKTIESKRMDKVKFPGEPATFKKKDIQKEIDHLLVGVDLLPQIEVEPLLSFGDVPSDHLPLIFEIKC